MQWCTKASFTDNIFLHFENLLYNRLNYGTLLQYINNSGYRNFSFYGKEVTNNEKTANSRKVHYPYTLSPCSDCRIDRLYSVGRIRLRNMRCCLSSLCFRHIQDKKACNLCSLYRYAYSCFFPVVNTGIQRIFPVAVWLSEILCREHRRL